MMLRESDIRHLHFLESFNKAKSSTDTRKSASDSH